MSITHSFGKDIRDTAVKYIEHIIIYFEMYLQYWQMQALELPNIYDLFHFIVIIFISSRFLRRRIFGAREVRIRGFLSAR